MGGHGAWSFRKETKLPYAVSGVTTLGTWRHRLSSFAMRGQCVFVRIVLFESANSTIANPSCCRPHEYTTWDRLLAEKKTARHGTKPDAKLFCELVYAVNTKYFDERGGYDFAKKYFEEAYRQAVKEIGSEDYIISAVMHADERNSRLSEQLGRDVYHYHLHVVYVPVVMKEKRFRKDHKDPEKAGKVKEVIPQIAQSNFSRTENTLPN